MGGTAKPESAHFLAEYGKKLLELGYPIVPIRPGTKHPGFKGWEKTEATPDRVNRWLNNGFRNGGVGILTKHFPAVDLDVQDEEIVAKLIAWCEENIGRAVRRIGHAPKTLLVYRTDEPFAKIASAKYSDFLGNEHKVEILGDGQQFVAFAIHPDTKKPYEWPGDDLTDIEAADLPTITRAQAESLVAYFETIVPDDWERVERAPSTREIDTSIPEPDRVLAHAKPKLDISTQKLENALKLLDPDMAMRDWVRVGMALHHQYGGGDEGFRLWNDWSADGVKYDPKEMKTRWRSFAPDLSNTDPVTAATIIRMARDEYAKRPTPDKVKFRLIHASDVLAKLGPINWLVKDFLEENTTGLVFGDPESFKSFLTLDIAFHIAAGKDWHGHPVSKGPVIYLAGEGHGGLARRFSAWERAHNVELAELPFYVSERAASLYDAENAAEVVQAVGAITKRVGRPALVVIDTLARNFGAGDENSTADMNTFIKHVDDLIRAHFECTVMIVHHTGHAHKERARGAMALKGGVDFEYRVDRVGLGLTTQFTCTKMKDAAKPKSTWFEGREVVIGTFDDDDMTSLVFEQCVAPVMEEKPLKGKQADLYEIIAREQPVSRETLRTIAEAEGVCEGADQFRNTLQPLKKKGVVVENEGGKIVTEDAFFTGESPVNNRPEGDDVEI
ncbi:MAG: AAA family ATPase [Pseudomonadota bacterium]